MHAAAPASASPIARRRAGRGDSRELTKAYRRYVERVQALDEPAVDLEAALVLAEDVMGHRRGAEVDGVLVAAHSGLIRDLADAVRRAGRGAMAQPALLARAIVLARTLERTGADRFAAGADRSLVAAR
jgi:hypothetical protein